MLNRFILSISLIASGHTAASEWQHTNPAFDPTGQVTLKSPSGVTNHLSNIGQVGLQSSASPTVLVVKNDAEGIKFSKHEKMTNISGCTVTGPSYDYCATGTNIVELSNEYDLTKSIIVLTVKQRRDDCQTDGSNNCFFNAWGASPTVSFHDNKHVTFTPGDSAGKGWYSKVHRNYVVDIDVYELDGKVVTFSREVLAYNSDLVVPVKNNELFIYSAANSGCRDTGNWIKHPSVSHDLVSETVTFSMPCSPSMTGTMAVVSYFIVSPN